MQIRILAYEHMTALDAVGPYGVLSRLPGAELTFVGVQRGPVRCDTGNLGIVVDAPRGEVLPPDGVVGPGWSGSGADRRREPAAVQGWTRGVDHRPPWTTSVCTRPSVLAAAGVLPGRHATTHWLATDWLAGLGAVP